MLVSCGLCAVGVVVASRQWPAGRRRQGEAVGVVEEGALCLEWLADLLTPHGFLDRLGHETALVMQRSVDFSAVSVIAVRVAV